MKVSCLCWQGIVVGICLCSFVFGDDLEVLIVPATAENRCALVGFVHQCVCVWEVSLHACVDVWGDDAPSDQLLGLFCPV